MSNQDEDEVEDELEELEAEIVGSKAEEAVEFPDAPKKEPVFAGELKAVGQQKARARARAAERAAARAAESMFA